MRPRLNNINIARSRAIAQIARDFRAEYWKIFARNERAGVSKMLNIFQNFVVYDPRTTMSAINFC